MTVSRCFASGNVIATGIVGGFAAGCDTNVNDCAALGNVSSGYSAYGFAANLNCTYNRCFAVGDVTATGGNGYACAFGTTAESGLFLNCYAAGNVSASESQVITIAFDASKNCYFSGALNGSNVYVYHYINTTNSYGDMTVFPEGYAGMSYGKTTAEMQSPAFVDLLNAGQADKPWVYKEGSYPVLSTVQFNSITVINTANGKIVASTARATEGNIVVLYTEPDSGYQLKTIQVNATVIDGNSFSMPNTDASVTAEFEPISVESETPQPSDNGSKTQTPDSTQNGGEDNSATPKPINPMVYIGVGILLLLIIAALILFIVRNKAKKQGAQSK